MKKILILTFIFIISFTSMSFRGCQINPSSIIFNGILANFSGGLKLEDNSSDPTFSIYVGANGTILRSSGETNIIIEQKTSGTTQQLNNVRGTKWSGFVFAVGNNGTIVYSTNTGNNWSVSPSVTSANLFGAELNYTYCYAAGNNGTIIYSYDEGANWFQVSSGTTRNLKAIGLNPQFQSVVIAVGEKGTILRSTDSGINWSNISLADTTITFYDISHEGLYFDVNIMCIVGNGGRIYKSTNQGLTWVQKPSGTTNTLRRIYFHTQDSAVVVGDNGTIRFTTNGGETWFTDSFFNSPSTRHFKGVALVNRGNKTYSAFSDSLFFVSDEPITIGIKQASSEVPNGFSLSQNYPNPFNPITKIRFNIPSFGKERYISLVIYDILGKEIETLVNENLRPGIYEAYFDGSKYSSGVYFYKLTAGDFTETKRMALIK